MIVCSMLWSISSWSQRTHTNTHTNTKAHRNHVSSVQTCRSMYVAPRMSRCTHTPESMLSCLWTQTHAGSGTHSFFHVEITPPPTPHPLNYLTSTPTLTLTQEPQPRATQDGINANVDRFPGPRGPTTDIHSAVPAFTLLFCYTLCVYVLLSESL